MADWYKVKKMLLWENQVWPSSVFEYSYDFRNKSWTTVQNDWWTLNQWTSRTTINSNGIVSPTRWQWDSNQYWIGRSIDATNAKKVTIQYEVYIQATSWWNLIYYSIIPSNGIDTKIWMQLAHSWTTASWYAWHTWQLWLPNGESLTSSTIISTGTWNVIWEVDLVNKTSKLTVNWTVTNTWTISNSTVSSILGSKYIRIKWWHDTGTIYLRSIYIKIE